MIFMDKDKKKKEKRRTTWVRDVFKERNQKKNIKPYTRNAIEK